jgi:nicotinamide phosphoribosyltransferase
MKLNPATLVDGYKIDHRRQYPQGTEIVVSNLTARSTRRKNTDKVVFAGLQYFLKEFLINQWNENFFKQDIEKVAADFNRRINNYLGPNQVGDEHIRDLHKLGYLPIEIVALPEGTEYPIKVPSMMIWNTKKEFFWVTNYLETILSATIWGICTSATTAHQYKKIFTKYALETVGNTDFVQWQGHDFSFRGMFGLEAACMSGAGHLFSFTGTDTIPAIDFLEQYYNADSDKELVGGSVSATEHSVACSTILDFVNKIRIDKNGEITEDELMNLADVEYVRHLITEVYPTGIISIVADSFDYWNTITNTAKALKDVILARDGKVVFRPDTGDPVKVVCGYTHLELSSLEMTDVDTLPEVVKYDGKYYFYAFQPNDFSDDFLRLEDELSSAEVKGSIESLWDIFGGTTTEKGYKLLDSHVGLIYGDSITLERAEQICQGLKKKGFASTNMVYGTGSFSYQFVTRDTDGYAVKATWAQINGQPMEIFKSPKGAEFKKSAKGLTAVFKNESGEFYLKDQATWDEVRNCEFVKVFEDGKLVKDYTLQEVRNNLSQYL